MSTKLQTQAHKSNISLLQGNNDNDNHLMATLASQHHNSQKHYPNTPPSLSSNSSQAHSTFPLSLPVDR